MSIAIIWILAAAVLTLVEMQTMEFTCLSLAVGCALAAGAAGLELSLGIQFAIAAIASGASLFVIAPRLRSRLLPGDVRGVDDLVVGARAVVLEAIVPPQEGKIKLHGVIWQALSDRAIPEGAQVLITELHGTKLTVIAQGEIEPQRALQGPQP